MAKKIRQQKAPEQFKPVVIDIPLKKITADADNERHHVNDGIESLMESMRTIGLQQPIRVYEFESTLTEPYYKLLGGHRRFYAAMKLGWEFIRAILEPAPASEADRHVLRLVDNLQHEELDPISFAEGIEKAKKAGAKQKTLAVSLGRSEPEISNLLRLLKLPHGVREHIRAGRLELAHGIDLLAVDGPELNEDGTPKRTLEQELELLGAWAVSVEATCKMIRTKVTGIKSHNHAIEERNAKQLKIFDTPKTPAPPAPSATDAATSQPFRQVDMIKDWLRKRFTEVKPWAQTLPVLIEDAEVEIGAVDISMLALAIDELCSENVIHSKRHGSGYAYAAGPHPTNAAQSPRKYASKGDGWFKAETEQASAPETEQASAPETEQADISYGRRIEKCSLSSGCTTPATCKYLGRCAPPPESTSEVSTSNPPPDVDAFMDACSDEPALEVSSYPDSELKGYAEEPTQAEGPEPVHDEARRTWHLRNCDGNPCECGADQSRFKPLQAEEPASVSFRWSGMVHKGQLAFPAGILTQHGFKNGDMFEFEFSRGRFVVRQIHLEEVQP